MFRNSGTKISLFMKAVSNKMIYVRIIQRLLKKLVRLRQKIEKSPLRTNKPFLLLPHRSKINTTKFRVFVPSIFEHPSDSLNSWLITASPIVESSSFRNELFIIPQGILVVASDNSLVYRKNQKKPSVYRLSK